LHNEELHNLYSYPDIIRQIKSRRMGWAEHVACMGEGRRVYKVLVGKPGRKRPLGRLWCRWDQNGSLGDWLRGWSRCNWLRNRNGGRLMNKVMNLRVMAPQS
jgi:hypothetical protein